MSRIIHIKTRLSSFRVKGARALVMAISILLATASLAQEESGIIEKSGEAVSKGVRRDTLCEARAEGGRPDGALGTMLGLVVTTSDAAAGVGGQARCGKQPVPRPAGRGPRALASESVWNEDTGLALCAIAIEESARVIEPAPKRGLENSRKQGSAVAVALALAHSELPA